MNVGAEIFKGIIGSLGTVVSGTSLLFITKAAMPPMPKTMPPITLDLTAQNAETLAVPSLAAAVLLGAALTLAVLLGAALADRR